MTGRAKGDPFLDWLAQEAAFIRENQPPDPEAEQNFLADAEPEFRRTVHSEDCNGNANEDAEHQQQAPQEQEGQEHTGTDYLYCDDHFVQVSNHDIVTVNHGSPETSSCSAGSGRIGPRQP